MPRKDITGPHLEIVVCIQGIAALQLSGPYYRIIDFASCGTLVILFYVAASASSSVSSYSVLDGPYFLPHFNGTFESASARLMDQGMIIKLSIRPVTSFHCRIFSLNRHPRALSPISSSSPIYPFWTRVWQAIRPW